MVRRGRRPKKHPALPAGRLRRFLQRAWPAATAGVALALASGCEEDPIGSPLSLELAGPGTGVAGEELSVAYDAAGRRLVGITFAWGDGKVDSLSTAGAQSASGSRRHTYESPGTFTVQARVEDTLEGALTAEVSIRVEDDTP